jgi:nicotinamidase-related amidase
MPPTRSHFPKSETALLIVDAINPFDFPGGQTLARRALKAARAIARLADRARHARIPVVFVNDNLGRWRSDCEALIEYCLRAGGPGAEVVQTLRPTEQDFVVLKSTLSGFHQTPLEAMLRQGAVKTTIVTGFVTGNCVLFTAAEAYMRDFKVVVPRDCVIDQTAEEHTDALKKMRHVLKAKTPAGSAVRLRR